MMTSLCNRLCSSAAVICGLFLCNSISISGQKIIRDTLTGKKIKEIHRDAFMYNANDTGAVAQKDIPEIQLTALKAKAGAERWWYAWLAGYSAATVGQGVVCFTSEDRILRQDMALGAATTFLGAMGQVITPVLTKNLAYPSYREYASGEASLSADQAAALLKALSEREKEGRSWKTHAIAGVVNLGSGLITWLGYKRTFMDGLENFAINTLITEAQIWTQPMKAVRDYEKYCQTAGPGTGTMTSRRDGEWSWSIYPGGFHVRYVF